MPHETLAGFPGYWQETGTGLRRALFLHCYLTHSGAWHGVQSHLDTKLRMRAVDMPGHGRAGDWQDGLGRDYQTCVTQMAAALIDQRADVIGHSFGATVALRLARDYPNKVRSLTLIEPVVFGGLRDQPVYTDHLREMASFGVAMAAKDYPAAAQAFDNIWGGGTPWADLPDAHRASLIKRIPLIDHGTGVTLDDIHQQTIPGAIEAIKQPVLLLEGAQSPQIIHALHADLAARLPNARRVMVAGAGHMVPLTHPAAIAGEIAAFLKV